MSATFEMRGTVAVITMDDGKANAIGHTMLDALNPLLDEAEEKADAVVLAGRPGKFCAGFDLKIMAGDDPKAASELLNRGGLLTHRLFTYPKPLVAAVTGHGLALGALILLACDTRIAVEGDFKFGLNETAIGMSLPTFGIELSKARLNPMHYTKSFIQAQIYNPIDAIDAGFVDEVVDADNLLSKSIATAEAFGKLPSKAYAMNKLAIRRPCIDVMKDSLA